MREEPKGPNPEYLVQYFDGILRMMIDAGKNSTGTTAMADDGEDDQQQTPFDTQDAAKFMAQASRLWLESSARFWGRSAEISSEFYNEVRRNIADIDSDSSDRSESEGALMDLLRGYVRQMVELPAQESRRLQAEIEKFVEKMEFEGNRNNNRPQRRGHRIKD